jgi:hypothetical protein
LLDQQICEYKPKAEDMQLCIKSDVPVAFPIASTYNTPLVKDPAYDEPAPRNPVGKKKKKRAFKYAPNGQIIVDEDYFKVPGTQNFQDQLKVSYENMTEFIQLMFEPMQRMLKQECGDQDSYFLQESKRYPQTFLMQCSRQGCTFLLFFEYESRDPTGECLKIRKKAS